MSSSISLVLPIWSKTLDVPNYMGDAWYSWRHSVAHRQNVNLGLLMGKRIQIRGCTLRSRTLEEKLGVTRRFSTQVMPLFANGTVKPIIEQVYPMQEIGEAHKAMAANKNFGKLIVTIE